MTLKSGATEDIIYQNLSLSPYFLFLLLAPLLKQPRFCFGSFEIENLAIDGTKSRNREIIIGFLKCSL